MTRLDTAPPRPARRVRWSLALGLLVLSPMFAEYLTGYDDSTGDPVALLAGLVVFCPLYGAAALVIREIARRFALRSPGIIALAAGFAILQAGVIDQSLFSVSYRDIDYWDSMITNTWIAPLGFSAYTALVFLIGHIVWSFCIPIAMVESLRPEASHRPWLRLPGLITAALFYLAAAAVVLFWHLDSEADHASAGQIAGSLAVVALLAVFAFTLGRRRSEPRNHRVPAPWLVAVLSLIAALAFDFMTEDWLGTAVGVALLVVSAAAVARFARSPQWISGHIVALAAGALVARALVGFLATPLGDIAPIAKYGHNTVLLMLAVGLSAWAFRVNRATVEAVGRGD